MLHARTDPRILGYLGRALSLELSAVQRYLFQAALVRAWGMDDAAARLRGEALEEMGHAERIVERMTALGVVPAASQVAPAGAAADLAGLLRQDALMESAIAQLYAEGAQLCARLGDREGRDFFSALLAEEEAHARELAEWIAELEAQSLLAYSEPGYPSRDMPFRAWQVVRR